MSKTTPENLAKKRSDEKMLVSEMIALYRRKQHHTLRGSLCPECQQLHDYALARIEHCPFMETKTFCANCKVHCYKKDMLGRAQNAAGASRSLHQACDRDNEGKA